jgi:hypothetical protein
LLDSLAAREREELTSLNMIVPLLYRKVITELIHFPKLIIAAIQGMGTW